LNCRDKPCAQCPWRADIPTGQFPAERYTELAATSGGRGDEAAMDAPLFGCHKASQEHPMPCAGWLAAIGYFSLHVRLLVANGEIPASALQPGEDWPPLYRSYDEMAEAQGQSLTGWSVCLTEGCRDFGRIMSVVPGYPCPTCGRGEMHDAAKFLRSPDAAVR
jgi:hypothetical protein